ncbi:MAG: helix-turn-helix transcriptional regulator [Clostridia bacterium]|nr:helix-turn-helix transcriptional regulator [Clostridia bacterium]
MDKAFIQEYKKIGLNIAYYRRMKSLTQEKLAELVDIDQTHMSKIERATIGVSLDLLFRIAEALEIEAYKLLIFRD